MSPPSLKSEQKWSEARVPFRAGLRLFWLLLSKNHFITRLSGASSARSVWFDSGRIVPLKVLHSSSSSSSKLNFIYIEDAQTRFSVEHGDSLCALYQCLTWSIAISFTPSLEQSPLNIDWWNIIPHLHLDHHTQSAIKQCKRLKKSIFMRKQIQLRELICSQLRKRQLNEEQNIGTSNIFSIKHLLNT